MRITFIKEQLCGSHCYGIGESAEVNPEVAKRLLQAKIAAPFADGGGNETASLPESQDETADMPAARRKGKK